MLGLQRLAWEAWGFVAVGTISVITLLRLERLPYVDHVESDSAFQVRPLIHIWREIFARNPSGKTIVEHHIRGGEEHEFPSGPSQRDVSCDMLMHAAIVALLERIVNAGWNGDDSHVDTLRISKMVLKARALRRRIPLCDDQLNDGFGALLILCFALYALKIESKSLAEKINAVQKSLKTLVSFLKP
jgi:hypothetical protein